ncbi:hypothetical protein AURDEDRAFT_109907 [Auricularia subglabra TFB-10046 SS5]|nr:hypothetical protein AURDEDRAFT_109907 [Auricularia subglabra TFB-10046 SS5]
MAAIRSVVRWGLIGFSFFVFLLLSIALVVSSAAALFLEARRTARDGSIKNLHSLYIGLAYVILVVVSLIFFAKRRRDVHIKLSKIPRKHVAIRREDVPKTVHKFISEEYLRSAAILYASQPVDGHQDGWGDPGTDFEGIRFRRRLLDTVVEVDEAARAIVPRLLPIRPHTRVLHHLRALTPLIPVDESGSSCLRRYDSVIEFARHARREPTEEEFVRGLQAASDLVTIFRSYDPYRAEDDDEQERSQEGSPAPRTFSF